MGNILTCKNSWNGKIREFYYRNRTILIACAILVVIALFTGIFTAIKINNIDEIDINKFSIITLAEGSIYSLSMFFARILSVLFVGVILWFSSKNVFVYIFGVAILLYRTYLLAINCAVAVIKLGIAGFVNSLIIFLCQLLIIVVLICFFVCCINANKKQKNLCVKNNVAKIIIFSLLIVLLIVIIEALLLLFFKSTTILIV